MKITGKQLLNFSRLRGNLNFKLIGSIFLCNNNGVLIGDDLFVSNAAFQLIYDDPTIRDNVIEGLNIEFVGAVSMISADLIDGRFHDLIWPRGTP